MQSSVFPVPPCHQQDLTKRADTMKTWLKTVFKTCYLEFIAEAEGGRKPSKFATQLEVALALKAEGGGAAPMQQG